MQWIIKCRHVWFVKKWVGPFVYGDVWWITNEQTSYDLFVLYDLDYLEVQFSMVDSVFDEFNLASFSFLFRTYLVNNNYGLQVDNLV